MYACGARMDSTKLKAWASKNSTSGGGDDAHPRDERGRFTSAGGGGGNASGGSGGAGTGAPAAVQRVWTDKRPAGLPEETWKAHYDKHPDQGGKPTEARKQSVHDPIVKAALNVRQPAPNEQKIAIMTMGGPASGKGSIFQDRKEQLKDFVKVDPDHVKEQLPEYKTAIDPKNTYTKAAEMAHEESSAVSKRIRDQAVNEGKHVLIDGTGANAEKFMKLHDDLKARGYEVQVHMPHIEPHEAYNRMLARADATGRKIPHDFFHTAHAAINANADKIRASVGNFTLYNSHDFKPIATKREGVETVHDKAGLSSFVNRKK